MKSECGRKVQDASCTTVAAMTVEEKSGGTVKNSWGVMAPQLRLHVPVRSTLAHDIVFARNIIAQRDRRSQRSVNNG